MLDLFFLSDAPPYPLLWAQHDPWLVALSVGMAVLASVLALQMAGLARRADTRFMRQMARGSGAMALGGGIWSMHFIGMLAFTVLGRGRFDPWMTALSMLPSVAASWVALGLLMRREISRAALVVGGVLVGAGIGAMHYIGMEASQWAPFMRFDPWGFAASVLVAVLLAIVALWVRFGLERVVRWRARWLNLAAGVVMGLAIAGMHYTGMAALRFIEAPNELELLAAAEGTPMALAVAAVALVIGVLVIAINAGLRYRQMFLQMRQSESRLRAIADTAVDGMVMIDAQGRVQSFNAAAERILGWRPEDVVGQNVSMLMPEPDRSRHDTYLQRYLQGQGGGVVGANSREALALRPDGSTVPIRISVGRVPLDGAPVFVGFISDTQRRAMEQVLRTAKERAEQAAAARSTFLANMSHEIRTPMNAIIGFTEALLDTPMDVQQRRHLGTVQHAARSMLRLQQVLLNVLGNALKFTERGQVLLRLDYHDGTLVIEVEDTGIGIAAQHLERIFDPFAQADASTTRQFGGTGLGTTISRQLVELMGGSISVRSTLGVGTTFTVCLPLPVGQALAAVANVSQALQLPQMRMLVVDDVPANIELLQIHLDRGRHQVTVARDGESAVAAYEAGHFDVVLMDLQMPVMDGLEATRRIRAFEQAQRRKPVPVIALSASVLEQDRRNARAAGMDGFASKPLDPARLFREIARVLSLHTTDDAMDWGTLVTNTRPSGLGVLAAGAGLPPAIDWERGLQLWGQMPLLRDALARLLQEHEGTPAALQTLAAQRDLAGVRALAHRLRGAAGNLALKPLQTLTQRIEEAAASMDATALPLLLNQLPASLAAVHHALAQDARQPAGSAAEGSLHAPLSDAQRTRARSAAQALQQALENAELAQPPLDLLAQLLPAAAMEPLQEAIDTFDFDQALQQLQQLRTHWIDEPTENPA